MIVAKARFVTCRREIGHARGGDVVHGLRNDAILEHRLYVVDEVVDDDRGTGVTQRTDIGCSVRLTTDVGGEHEGGAGCHVVNDLEHRPPFVDGK